MSNKLKIGSAAEFRMYARQLRLFGGEEDIADMQNKLQFVLNNAEFDHRYIELFKMCCDLDFVEALGSAGVSHCHDRGLSE